MPLATLPRCVLGNLNFSLSSVVSRLNCSSDLYIFVLLILCNVYISFGAFAFLSMY